MPLQNAAASIAATSTVTATAAVHASAAGVFAGSGSITAAAVMKAKAACSLSGSGVFTSAARTLAKAGCSAAGSGHLVCQTDTGEESHATLSATSFFFVDPTKVITIPFFKATHVPVTSLPSVALLPKAIPGTQPVSTTVGIPATTRRTQTGGVPNKG